MARARLGLSLAVALWLASPLGHAVIVAPPLAQPAWTELNAEQRQVLAPLATEWDQMGGFQRKKWLGIVQRYQTLSTEEQGRLQRRMTDWAKLSPDERKQARDKFKSLQQATPEKKEAVKAKWQEYKDLPESEKTRLQAEAKQKPAPQRPVAKPPLAANPAPAANPPAANTSPPPIAPVDPAAAR